MDGQEHNVAGTLLRCLTESTSSLSTIISVDSQAPNHSNLDENIAASAIFPGLFSRLQLLISTLKPIQLDLTEDNLKLQNALLSNGGTLLDQVKLLKLYLKHPAFQANQKLPQQLHSAIPNITCHKRCPHCATVGFMAGENILDIATCEADAITLALTMHPYDPIHDPMLPCCLPIGT
jgi:hypothetical protein